MEPLLAAPPDPPDATNLLNLVGPVFGKPMTTISKLTFRNLDEGERMIVGWACIQYPPELRLHAKREAEINGKARWNTGFSYDAKWAIDPSTGERLDTSMLSIPFRSPQPSFLAIDRKGGLSAQSPTSKTAIVLIN